MTELERDLSYDFQVTDSKIINHPEYFYPVLMVRYGWKRVSNTAGTCIAWHRQEIVEIKEDV